MTGRTNTSTTINKLFMQNKFGALNSNYNSKVVSTLINTANWDGYANTAYADYAIGAPTLEMWVASWNGVYGDKLKLYTNKNAYGYYVGTGSNSTTNYFQSISAVTDWQNNTLYFPHGNSQYQSCYGTWLASPSALDTYNLMRVLCNGNVDLSSYGGNMEAVRPLVHLKSNFHLERKPGTTNVWQIINN